MILLAIFIYVFTLLGMTMFAGNFKFDLEGRVDMKNGSSPRSNFDNITDAVITTFQIMVGDSW